MHENTGRTPPRPDRSSAITKLLAITLLGGGHCAGVAAPAFASPEPGIVFVTGPGGESARVTGLNSNGEAGTGYSFFDSFSPARLRSFVWTPEGGRVDVPGNPLPYQSEARAIDNSGTMIAGTRVAVRNGGYLAFRRDVNAAQDEVLPLLPEYGRAIGTAISGDGRSVVGYCERGQNTYFDAQAFLWREGVGTIPLGFLRPNSVISDATAISRDGSTVVGVSINGSLDGEAFTWTEAGGMRALRALPNALYVDTKAHAVSADGRVIVGTSFLPSPTVRNGLEH